MDALQSLVENLDAIMPILGDKKKKETVFIASIDATNIVHIVSGNAPTAHGSLALVSLTSEIEAILREIYAAMIATPFGQDNPNVSLRIDVQSNGKYGLKVETPTSSYLRGENLTPRDIMRRLEIILDGWGRMRPCAGKPRHWAQWNNPSLGQFVAASLHDALLALCVFQQPGYYDQMLAGKHSGLALQPVEMFLDLDPVMVDLPAHLAQTAAQRSENKI